MSFRLKVFCYTPHLRLVLLDNKSTVPFITGDQPVVNTHATSVPVGEQVHELEFYYPISPLVAVLVTKDKTRYALDVVAVDEPAAATFNDHIVKNSLDEIYANSREQLDALVDLSIG